MPHPATDPESIRLEEDRLRLKNWKRWGPYLAERQWGTVREDYSASGDAWDDFTREHARSRAYRWGEDGLFGITDRQCRLCFSIALWNERDPILKERLFGLSGPEGNHGEDVKECYYYLDSTPTHSYLKGLYKYPLDAFPYLDLIAENGRRSRTDPEYELLDTGIFNDGRYADVSVEYAKASPNDILIRITCVNRGSEARRLHVLPMVWFRNTWSWGRDGEGYWDRPFLKKAGTNRIHLHHASLGDFQFAVDRGPGGNPGLLFTDNETNARKLFGSTNSRLYTKDAFHEYVVGGRSGAVNPDEEGTRCAAQYVIELPPEEPTTVHLRLSGADEAPDEPFDARFGQIFQERMREADDFYDRILNPELEKAERTVARQAFAGLLWNKQFYHYSVPEWLEGDPAHPAPPERQLHARNTDWTHLYNRDVVSMPDSWEYPWYAAWDLAFHMIPFAGVDPEFARHQLTLFLREWYMHPNGQIPAYEWSLSDVNPPVHAWAAWRVYKMTGRRGQRDRRFLASIFQKLLVNFTWWVNRKDDDGNHLFSGGFLGLDNIGLFDRNARLPGGAVLEQADATAWMGFYAGTMLSMALELAAEDPSYEDVASKFFEHFIAISEAMNSHQGTGLWHEEDGFYHDHLRINGQFVALRDRSLVGLIPLIACEVLDASVIDRLPGFRKRMNWFLENRSDVFENCSCLMESPSPECQGRRLLALVSRPRLERLLHYLLDENEFLSPFGIRSLSRIHEDAPYTFRVGEMDFSIRYVPGESESAFFGGNSNWRGPVWFPINYLLIEALERYHHFFGSHFTVEFPTGSGFRMTLDQVAAEIARRLASLFLPDQAGHRPSHGGDEIYAHNPHWKDLVLFYEYFHPETGRGMGASHQTGWTALVTRCLKRASQADRSRSA